MSNKFYHPWDFDRDLANLVRHESTTLETLNERMLRVDDPESRMTEPDQELVASLSRSWTQSPSFVSVRLSELFHGARLEHNDDYVLAAVGHLGGRWDAAGIRGFMLTHDEYLREHVFWHFFEVEGGGEISLANVDKFSGTDSLWKDAVVGLVDDGVLDRDRILRSSLEALNRDFSSYRAGWFSRLYDTLKPGAAEAVPNQDLLHRLLASANTATVALAVRQAALLHRAGSLDADSFVKHCAPAVAGPKTSALKVLGILRALAAAGSATADGTRFDGAGFDGAELFDAVAVGLSHPHRDVQHAAATLLLEHRQTVLLAEGLDALSPAMAAEFAIAVGAGAIVTDHGDGSDAAVPPTRPAARPVRHWTDDEALERFAVLLENPNDAIDIDLALAWLSSHDPATVVRPLARRAAKLNDPEFANENIVVDVVLAATDPGHAFRPGRGAKPRCPEENSVVPVFHKRVREVVEIIQHRGERRTLLATPTEANGWIDPGTLVARFLEVDGAGLGFLHFDALAALLRVGPDGRAEALKTLQASAVAPANAEARNALAYALGGPAAQIVNAAWWVAAARARAPHAADEHLRTAGLVLPGQADPATLSFAWTGRRESYEQRGKQHHYTWWTLALAAAPAGRALADFPTVIPSRSGNTFLQGTALDFGQLALTVPASTLPFAAAAASTMKDALGATSPNGEEHLLAALENHPGRWSEATAELLALALSAARADIRIMAAELFTTAVPARVDTEAFAAGMARCAGPCTLSRWATSLADAASISGPSARSVLGVLGHLLPVLEHGHHGVGKLLSVLLDESVRHGKVPEGTALRGWLAGFTGSSATTRTARQLLAL